MKGKKQNHSSREQSHQGPSRQIDYLKDIPQILTGVIYECLARSPKEFSKHHALLRARYCVLDDSAASQQVGPLRGVPSQQKDPLRKILRELVLALKLHFQLYGIPLPGNPEALAETYLYAYPEIIINAPGLASQFKESEKIKRTAKLAPTRAEIAQYLVQKKEAEKASRHVPATLTMLPSSRERNIRSSDNESNKVILPPDSTI